MRALRWIVLAICLLWALGGLVVMAGYGVSPLSVAVNFGPLMVAILWIALAARRNSN